MKSDIFLLYACLNFIGLAYQNYLGVEAHIIAELKLSFNFYNFAYVFHDVVPQRDYLLG